MIPITYSVRSEKTSPVFCRAFAAGCKGFVSDDRTLQPGPVAMFGSPVLWPLLQQAITAGRTWYFGDHAYFGRQMFYRITRDAYQHTGTGASDGSRFRAFGRPVQPWRTAGRHVLICPQSATYFGLFGLNGSEWVSQTMQTIAMSTDRQVRVRWKHTQTPIAQDLKDCWAVVTYSSAAALDALIAGVPVFVLADFAATWTMGLPDLSLIERPFYPEGREPFLWNLADHQWTIPEIASGMAWSVVKEQAVAA